MTMYTTDNRVHKVSKHIKDRARKPAQLEQTSGCHATMELHCHACGVALQRVNVPPPILVVVAGPVAHVLGQQVRVQSRVFALLRVLEVVVLAFVQSAVAVRVRQLELRLQRGRKWKNSQLSLLSGVSCCCNIRIPL